MNLFKSFMNQKVTIVFNDHSVLSNVVISDVDTLFFTLENCKKKIYSLSSVKSVEAYQEGMKKVCVEDLESDPSKPTNYSDLVDKLPEFPDN